NDLQKKIDEILNSVNTAIIDNFGDRPELNRFDRWDQEAANEFGGTTVMTPELLSDEFLILGNVTKELTSTLEEERDRLRRQIHLLPDLPNAPKLEEAKAQAVSMGRAIKAVVGDFE